MKLKVKPAALRIVGIKHIEKGWRRWRTPGIADKMQTCVSVTCMNQ